MSTVPIYGLLNSHNPYIGYFHYSPNASGSRHYEYISPDITSTAEVQRRRQIKFHPLTGCFHFAPGKYSDLHGLKNYRHSATASSVTDNSSTSSGSGNEFDVTSSSSSSSRIDKRVTFGFNSRDDAAIVTDKTLDRYSSHKPIYKRTNSSDSPPAPRKGRMRLPTHLNGLPPDTSDSSAPTSPRPPPPPSIPLTTPENSWEIHSNSSRFQPSVTATITATDSISNLPAKYSIGRKVGEGSYARVYLGALKTATTTASSASNAASTSGNLVIPIPLSVTPPTTAHNTPIGTPRTTTPTPEARVAVKVIRKSLLPELATAVREIENHSKVSNGRGRGTGGETIVSLQDTYESSEFYYMMLEWCDGGTLEDMLQLRRKLTEEEVKLIAHQLLIGVLYLHTNGIVHADIKPANILFSSTAAATTSTIDLMYYKKLKDGSLTVTLPLVPTFPGENEDVDDELLLAQQRCSMDPDSRTPSPVPLDDTSSTGETRFRSPYGLKLKICDFGLSQRIPDVKHYRHTGDINKAPYKLTGTPGFLSPELLLQHPYGRPADMWAVGVVLFQALSGSAPFNPPSVALDREVSFRGHSWKHISSDGIDLIKGLLQKDENLRTKASDALNHRWFNDISLIYNHGMRK